MIARTRINWPLTDYYGRVLADGPTSFWPLDELHGLTAQDLLNANTGTYQGNLAWVPGPFSLARGCLQCDGSTTWVETATEYTNPTVFSLEGWFRTTAAQGGIINFTNMQGNSGLTDWDRHLYIESTGVLAFGVYTGSTVVITTPNAVTDGKWHHAVATIGSGGMALYLDGSLVATNSNTSSQNYSGWWHIGWVYNSNWPNAPSNYYFSGQLASVAVYPYVLSASQVLAHYNAGRTGLVGV